MKPTRVALALLAAVTVAAQAQTRAPQASPATDDPWLWLEAVRSDSAMQWVRHQDSVTVAQ
jgi:hypothetical protein